MNIDKRIANVLPKHYGQYYPRFITFLEKYYAWLYRNSGLSDSEIDDLRNDTSWLQKDIDKFISTGEIRYFDDTQDVLDARVEELDNTANPGYIASSIIDKFMLEDDFNSYNYGVVPVDGANDPLFELETIDNQILDGWFNSMGFDRIKRKKVNDASNIDQILLLSLLKHIYAIKGTETSIRLFFNLFFDEDVVIYQPKHDIALIDDNWILEDAQIIRDDERYQEFSYVIVVSQDVSAYSDIFTNIYLKLIHPIGFRVELEKFDITQGLPLENGGYLLVEPGVYLDIGQ